MQALMVRSKMRTPAGVVQSVQPMNTITTQFMLVITIPRGKMRGMLQDGQLHKACCCKLEISCRHIGAMFGTVAIATGMQLFESLY